MKIIHVMSDGTERDSIEGFVIPLNEETKPFYELISKMQGEQSHEQLSSEIQ